jgi:hypothetical protein
MLMTGTALADTLRRILALHLGACRTPNPKKRLTLTQETAVWSGP